MRFLYYKQLNVINKDFTSIRKQFLLVNIFFIVMCIFSDTGKCKAQLIISGQILDSANNFIPHAILSLHSISDTTYIKKSLADVHGQFSFNVPTMTTYTLSISHLQYKEKTVLISKEMLESRLPLKIYMQTIDYTLKGITILKKKPFLEKKVDRLVYNIDNSSLVSGGSAWEALIRLPGVSSDGQGNVKAFSKGASLMINDRIIKLSPESISNMLKGMSAEDIASIEIITAPPAKYEAGSGLLINIKTKKMKKNGYKGNLRSYYEHGKYGRYLTGGNMYYKSKMIAVNIIYNFLQGAFQKLQDENIRYASRGTTWHLDTYGKNEKSSHTYSLAVDYFINANNRLGIQVDGFAIKNEGLHKVNTNIFSYKNSLDSVLLNYNTSRTSSPSNTINVNYEHKLKKKGAVNVNMGYTIYRSNNTQQLLTSSFNNQQVQKYTSVVKINSNQNISIKSAKLDYAQMFKGNIKVEAGAKLSSIFTDNNIGYKHMVDGDYINNPLKSNQFTYKENKEAVYLSLKAKKKSLTMQLGIRGEYTQTKGTSHNLSVTNKKNYLNLFPTISFLYKINDKDAIDLSYNKGITRPEYWRLNPFRFYTTPYTYFVGNPFLKPSISRSMSTSYTLNNQYIFVFYYNNILNDFTQITEQDPQSETLRYIEVNLGKSKDFGFYFILPFNVFPWWENNINIELSRQTDQSSYLDSSFHYTNNRIYISSNNSFTLSNKLNWSAELNGWYSSSGLQGLFKSGSSFDVSIGTRKFFFNKKISLSVSLSDIFWSNFSRTYVDYKNQQYDFIAKNDTRKWRLSISYKFGNNNTLDPHKRETGSAEERRRIKK